MRWSIGLFLTMLLCCQPGCALLGKRGEVARVNGELHGQVFDFTHNHGVDRRIWSPALQEKRDLYVYVPPGYHPTRKYPLAIFLHGASQDEQFFLKSLVKEFDKAIADGTLPPFVVAGPDGSILGRQSFFKMASFWANSDAGRFEDYLMDDVWTFLTDHFSIAPERDAHVMLGASAGGAGAFNCAIKHKHKIKVAMGFMPALNLRWVDCHEHYEAPFDPNCWGWRTRPKPWEVIGRPKGPFKVRAYNLFGPLVGHGPDSMLKLSRFNPIEVMDTYDLKPGEVHLYIAYGGKDEFNIAAQVESFVDRARQRGIAVGVDFDPEGRHDAASGRRLFPGALRWVTPLVEHYKNDKSLKR
jgi:S-formylglutathione hydrolase FrmB